MRRAGCARGRAPPVGGRTVGENVTDLDLVALPDQRLLVDAGALVGAGELLQREGVTLVGALLLDHDLGAGDLDHLAVDRRQDHVPGVLGAPTLDTGADEGASAVSRGTA
jgi:hypothetical protein